ncbi:hypothetical protein D3C85_1174000 [compost metagenome]
MALGDGQDRTAEHFGGIGAEAQAQSDHAGGEGIEFKAGNVQHLAQPVHQADGAEVNQQYPQQFRNAAHQSRIGAAQPLQGTVRGSLGQCAEQAEHQAQAQGRERQFHGHQRASREGRAESVEINIHG